jgi:hypothetical protein
MAGRKMNGVKIRMGQSRYKSKRMQAMDEAANRNTSQRPKAVQHDLGPAG